MKTTRRQIKKIIKEAISHELGKIYVVADKNDVAPDNSSAFKVSDNSQAKLINKLGVTSSKGKKPHYVWAQSEFPTLRKSKSLEALGISSKESKGETRSIYKVGEFTSGRGDPFTFDKISNGKYRVISGPTSKSIGKIYSIPDKNLSTPSPGESFGSPDRQKQSLFVQDLVDYSGGRFHGNSRLQEIYMDFANDRDPNLNNLSSLPNELVASLDNAFKSAVDFIVDSFMEENVPSKSAFSQVLTTAGFPAEINENFTDYMELKGLVAPDSQDTAVVTRSLDEGSKRISRSQLRKIISSIIF